MSISTEGIERFRIESSGTISSAIIGGGTTTYPSFLCRAFVNFNGTTNTGGFCTIRQAGNVTSVADNGTGDYTINLAESMPDTNYTVTISSQAATNRTKDDSSARTSSSFRVGTFSSSFIASDSTYVEVAIFR